MEFFDTHITQLAKENVMHCLNSRHLSEGKLVDQFERALEKTFGYKNCVAVNSGTAALHLALLAAGVEPGDEVILPAQTFVATGMAVMYCGAIPVFADIRKVDGNISPMSVLEKITDRTKAVIAVSWGGNPCLLNSLEDICSLYGLVLIQDNAQALGATYSDWKSHPVTYWGDFSCFSFQAIKHLTTGDGGLVVCNQRHEYEYVKDLRWFGINREHDLPDATGERRYNLAGIGYKYHMNDYAAALGLGNLEGIHGRIIDRALVARIYDLEIPEKYQTDRNLGSSNWIYTLLIDDRDAFLKMMHSKGIPASVVHVGIDRNEVFGEIREELEGQRYWDEHHVCLPCHPSLTQDDIFKITEAINGGW